MNEENSVMVQDDYVDDFWKFSTTLSAEQRKEVKDLLESIPIWKGIGCLNTGEYMPMPIKKEFIGKGSKQNSYPMSSEKRGHYDKFEEQLESQGVIEDSSSTEYCSPCLIVMRNGRPRFVVDFRKINEMTPSDVYPLPRQTDVFDAVKGCEYISLFDFTKMFYQLPIHPDDRAKTTFKTRHRGAKQLTRSLMGYINSPAHCQRIVDRIIKRYKWIFVVVYMDDVVIYLKTWQDHLKHITWVLKEIQKVGLTLDAAKAYVGFKSIGLLGHVVNCFGLATQQKKVAAMMQLKAPTTVREVMQVLGFFGSYRMFIRCYAHIVEPITNLLKVNVKSGGNSQERQQERLGTRIKWGRKQETAFQRIKEALRNATFLSHSFDGEDVTYRLYHDACKIGLGAALHVVLPPSKSDKGVEVERPCIFISRSLKQSEKSFWPTELEMLGLVWSLQQPEESIEGKKLEIFTDHSALLWLFNATNTKSKCNQRLLVWTLSLQKWKTHASIVHRPGRAHLVADVLSRFPVDIDTPGNLRRTLDQAGDHPPIKDDLVVSPLISTVHMSNEFHDSLVTAYKKDKHWGSLYAKLSEDLKESSEMDSSEYHSFTMNRQTGLLYFSDPKDKSQKLCVPIDLIQNIFKMNHDDFGHPGFDKTYARIREDYHVDKLTQRLKSYIKGCHICLTSKNKLDQSGKLIPLEIPWVPFDTIAMDFVTGLPQDAEYDAILTITDKFSKMIELLPCRTTDSAESTALMFLKHHYSRFGLPRNMISDRDTRFVARFWQELFKRLHVTLRMPTAYAPQTDGQSERTNQTIETMLRSFVGYDLSRKWVEELPIVEFSVNSQVADALGKSPFEVIYGGNPRSMNGLLEKHSSYDDPSITLIGERRDNIRKDAIDALHYARAIMALNYDKSRKDLRFKKGDKVFLENNPSYRIPGLSRGKLAPRRFGPFKIIEEVGKGAFRLRLPDSYRIHDVVSRRHLLLANEDEWNRIPDPPPAIEELGDDTYEVECVIDLQKNRKSTEYLVKWKGYPLWESSWIHESQRSTFEEAIHDYEERKTKQHHRGR